VAAPQDIATTESGVAAPAAEAFRDEEMVEGSGEGGEGGEGGECGEGGESGERRVEESVETQDDAPPSNDDSSEGDEGEEAFVDGKWIASLILPIILDVL